MESKKIIAKKCEINYLRQYLYVGLFVVLIIFMLIMGFTKWRTEDGEMFITILVCSFILLIGVIILIMRIISLKRIPETLMWYEDGFVYIYDGFKFRPSDIYKIKQGAKNNAVILYTAKGKHRCGFTDNPRNVIMLLKSLQYGGSYLENDLRVLMKKRQEEKF